MKFNHYYLTTSPLSIKIFLYVFVLHHTSLKNHSYSTIEIFHSDVESLGSYLCGNFVYLTKSCCQLQNINTPVINMRQLFKTDPNNPFSYCILSLLFSVIFYYILLSKIPEYIHQFTQG